MEADHNKENRYLRAKEQVGEMKKFYTSLFFYIIIISFLGGLNYYVNEWRYMWFLWAAFGWGIGLIFQAAKAFNWAPFMNKNWEEKKIKELMDKEDKFTNNRWS
ncbi:MAG: histidine kinase [Alteromonas sp.]|nr:histidine kinase [Alteromonas sp.]MAY23108.1 histidine kinase [Flavobacteriaceae bacterium]|tara:strand:+ start:73 stop:384 length:312 start_codon:yes stop_codon:yes gene_type:complete